MRRKWLFNLKKNLYKRKWIVVYYFIILMGMDRDISIVFRRLYYEIIFCRIGICIGLLMVNILV